MKPVVLIVEDDEDLRGSIESVLIDRAYIVHVAYDGLHAAQILEHANWKPDLIVSDIMMPRMDGFEFFECVHRMPELRAVPFVFLTARNGSSDLRQARRMGIDDYLVKPFEPDDFILVVENKLRRSAEMREQASSQLDEARRTMVQLLSHELRTPLTYVSGGWQLLLEELNKVPMGADTQMSLELIGNGTMRLNRLVEQMVLYAQLAAGHGQVQMQTAGSPINMRSLTENVVASLHDLITARDIQLKQTLTDGQFYVLGIADLLGAAISEVIRNAVMYSPEGSPVWLELYAEGDHLMLIVTDHGHGIPADDLPDVWKILSQSNRQHWEQQGAGMGLPIAKRVCEVHGGTIQLDSAVNQGTQVVIRLPLY